MEVFILGGKYKLEQDNRITLMSANEVLSLQGTVYLLKERKY